MKTWIERLHDRVSGTPRAMVQSDTPEWCVQTLLLLRSRWDRKDLTVSQWDEVIKELETAKAWETLKYPNLDAMLTTEIGRSFDEMKAGVLGKNGGDRKSAEYQIDNCQSDLSVQGGNDPAYLTARIARDHPDILERMKAGEYRSTRQAAIEAGIIDPAKAKRYQLPTDPEAAGRYMAARVDHEWLIKFCEAFTATQE